MHYSFNFFVLISYHIKKSFSYTHTHWVTTLLRIVNSKWHKELGRRTGWNRPYQPKWVPGKRCGKFITRKPGKIFCVQRVTHYTAFLRTLIKPFLKSSIKDTLLDVIAFLDCSLFYLLTTHLQKSMRKTWDTIKIIKWCLIPSQTIILG